MTSIFEQIYANAATQTCICCNKTAPWRGWDDLCNRTCYYALCDLLNSFNKGAEPDSRIVAYFTKYPEPSHSFNDEQIMAYIKQKTNT